MRRCTNLGCFATILAGLLPSGLSATEFSSAVFEDERAWTQSIEFPAGIDDLYVVVPCVAAVTKLGAIRHPSCFYTNRIALPFVRAVVDALDVLRFRPATVDGETAEVMANFSVKFFRVEKRTNISVAMNHGRYSSIYGDNYIDPQRLTRLRHYPDGICAPNGRSTWLTIFVSADGTVSSPQLPAEAPKPCVDEFTRALRMMVMVPASVAGKATDAFFSHPFFGLWQGKIVRLETKELSP